MMNSWTKLQLPANTSTIPSLYVKYDLTGPSYKILITDLTNIWAESLARTQILQRAFKLSTSIDPSDDKEQLNVLLQKVQDAVHCKKGTQTKLSLGSNPEELQLGTLTSLPAPCEPLEWHFNLLRLPHGALIEELLLPLLQDHAGLAADAKALTTA